MAIALTLTEFTTAYPDFAGIAQIRFDAFLLRTETQYPLKGVCDPARRLEMQKLALAHLLSVFPDPATSDPVSAGKYIVEIESRHDRIKYADLKGVNPYDLEATPYGTQLCQMMGWEACGTMFVVP